MKKVAICYSGQPRSIERTFQNHLDFLINPLVNSGAEVDIFAHIWFDPGLINKPFWEGYPSRGVWLESTPSFIVDCMKPKSYLIEKPKKFNEMGFKPDARFPHPISNTLSMFYGIESVFALKSEYEAELNKKYDFSVRIRPDLMFSSFFIDLDDIAPSSVNVIFDSNKHTDYSIGDHFAIGSNETMNIYSKVFSHFSEIIESGSAINPECLLGYWLKMNSLETRVHLWKHCLYRDYDTNRSIFTRYFGNIFK